MHNGIRVKCVCAVLARVYTRRKSLLICIAETKNKAKEKKRGDGKARLSAFPPPPCIRVCVYVVFFFYSFFYLHRCVCVFKEWKEEEEKKRTHTQGATERVASFSTSLFTRVCVFTPSAFSSNFLAFVKRQLPPFCYRRLGRRLYECGDCSLCTRELSFSLFYFSRN